MATATAASDWRTIDWQARLRTAEREDRSDAA
jgi:hypothetical protein